MLVLWEVNAPLKPVCALIWYRRYVKLTVLK